MRDIYAFLAKKALRRKPMVQAVWSAGACSRTPKRRQAAAHQSGAGVPPATTREAKERSGFDVNAEPPLVGTPRRGVRGGLGETALPGPYLACVRTFTERAGTPALPAVPRIKHALDSHTP